MTFALSAASSFTRHMPLMTRMIIGIALPIYASLCLRAERSVAGAGILMFYAPIWMPIAALALYLGA